MSAHHDSVPQIVNYAMLLAELGQQQKGLLALQKLSGLLRTCVLGNSRDAATVYEAMGTVCLMQRDARQAVTYYNCALERYAAVLEAAEWEKKRQELQNYCRQTGFTASLLQIE